jgi:hypothetical protein
MALLLLWWALAALLVPSVALHLALPPRRRT